VRLKSQIKVDTEHCARLKMDVPGLQSMLEQDRARIADLKADGEHQVLKIDQLSAELEQAPRPWWRKLISSGF
jgi:hypothetical protein